MKGLYEFSLFLCFGLDTFRSGEIRLESVMPN